MPVAAEDLANYVAEVGSVVGGGAALGAGAAFVAAVVARDLRFEPNVARWVERGGGYGGVRHGRAAFPRARLRLSR
jgi:hypothetical protein